MLACLQCCLHTSRAVAGMRGFIRMTRRGLAVTQTNSFSILSRLVYIYIYVAGSGATKDKARARRTAQTRAQMRVARWRGTTSSIVQGVESHQGSTSFKLQLYISQTTQPRAWQ